MMMRYLGVGLLWISFIHLKAGDFPIPTVPSSIEIAEIKLKITPEAQREIQKDVNALRASEKYFNIKLDRALLYFPIIEKVFREEGVPDDIKFLSLQESALISDQVSSASAVGYWQFKDFTAREVGLRVDSKIDERKNIVSSSRGAARYMKQNNFMLKNWIYSVNAYMTGPGGVRPYINQSELGSDKMTIDKNTHWYVKRFIAHVIAFKGDLDKQHSEGLRLITYDQGKNKELSQIAKQFDIHEDLVYQYNKWLVHGKIPDDKIYTVVIPVVGKTPKIKESASKPVAQTPTSYPDKIVANLNKMSKTIFIDINKRQTVLASENDNLSSLASKAGITIDQLKKYNELTGNTIENGTFYFTERKRNKSRIRYHVTQYGETLWDIAQHYGVKLKKIRNKNRMEPTEKVMPGRIIWLKQSRPKDMEPEYRPVTKPVEMAPEMEITSPKTETYPIIAKQKAPDELERTPVEENKPIATNDPSHREPSVFVATPEESPAPEPAEPVQDKIDVHEVVAGESLYAIAKKYDITVEDINEWNGLERNEAIHPGQKLQVAEPVEVGILDTYEEKPAAPAKSSEKTHMVKPDDTFYSISKIYNVTIEDLLRRNRMDINDPIKPGQQLVIPKPIEPTKTPEIPGNTYKVQAGDTFYKISREFNITVEELMQLNGKKEPHLSIGEEIRVK